MRIAVLAHPNSKKPRIEKDLFGSLHVHVSKPPIEGQANKAVAQALAEYFKVAKSQVTLVRGAKSQQKIFDVQK